MLRPGKIQTGFTLIEVIVALAIIAIGMAAAVKTVSSTTLNSAYLRDKTFSYWVAQNQLAEIEALDSTPPIGTSNGEEKLAGITWYWTREVNEIEDFDTRQIILTIRKNKDKKSQAYATLTTLVFNP